MSSVVRIWEKDAPIFLHENDRGQTKLPIAGTFSKREKIADDLEVIPASGHAPGTTMFLWNNGEHRVLFPGDSIWVPGGEWKAVLLGESDRGAYLASLSCLMGVPRRQKRQGWKMNHGAAAKKQRTFPSDVIVRYGRTPIRSIQHGIATLPNGGARPRRERISPINASTPLYQRNWWLSSLESRVSRPQ